MSRRHFLAGGAGAALAWSGRNAWAQSAAAINAGLVQTPLGPLRGMVIDDVRVFRGVPFAEPPVGKLRFRPPVKVRSWGAERNATRFAAEAMQDGDQGVGKSEDCLYLNVWTPLPSEGLPVFVWIHGGGFTGGRSFDPIFDGTEFAKAGMVVVTVAYRLGVFGFLEMEPLLGPKYSGSANNAVKDLICALEWVRENIAAFGGDPKRVTIGGESAGAKMTDVLMGTPEAQGLFAQMISESGGAERVWYKAGADEISHGFGEIWGRGEETLKTAPAASLIEAQVRLMETWPKHFPLRMEVDGLLIPRLPVETIADGRMSGTRLLIGTNRDESALFVGPHPQAITVAELGNVPLDRFEEVFARYKAVYPHMTEEQLRVRALTAEEYWVPSVRVADAQVMGGGTAWMYRLDFAPGSGRMKDEAYHSEELQLVWDKPNKKLPNVSEENALAKQVHAAWVEFIKGDTPGAESLPIWPEYTTTTRETMVFDTVSRVEEHPQEAELGLWDGVM